MQSEVIILTIIMAHQAAGDLIMESIPFGLYKASMLS